MDKYQHGGDIYSNKVACDFSANINPLGMPKGVREVLAQSVEEFAHYPDCCCRELVNRIAAFENRQGTYVREGDIVCGNGAADLIYRLVSVIRPQQALLLVPSFSEYEKALRTVCCRIQYHILLEENEFRTTETLLQEITDEIDLLFVCSPNNPTGVMIDGSLMERIIAECEEKSVWLIVDECFLDFTGQEDASVRRWLAGHQKLVAVKAFTKLFAMAGLRLGYMLSRNSELCRQVFSYGQCWSVSVPAQLAGAAVLQETGYIEKTVRYIKEERQFLYRELQRLGCRVYPGEANFLLFRCSPAMGERLLQRQIAIRDCENYYGLSKGYFRTAVRTHAENVHLIQTMEHILQTER